MILTNMILLALFLLTTPPHEVTAAPAGPAARPFAVYDDAFTQLIGAKPQLKKLATRDQPLFHEAAVWVPERDAVLVSSNRISDASGQPRIVLSLVHLGTGGVTPVPMPPPLDMPNGGVRWDGQRIVIAEQGRGARGASLVVLDVERGSSTTLLADFHGLAFNSINDVAIAPNDGALYFTDPPYGYAQGFREVPALPAMVWRFDPRSGEVRAVADGLQRPNGLAFSSDGESLYVSDTGFYPGDGSSEPAAPRAIYRFRVDWNAQGSLTDRRLFAVVDHGVPDGLKVDHLGHVWAACGDGVHVFERDSGRLLGKIHPPGDATVANLTFVSEHRLVLLAEHDIYLADFGASEAPTADAHDTP